MPEIVSEIKSSNDSMFKSFVVINPSENFEDFYQRQLSLSINNQDRFIILDARTEDPSQWINDFVKTAIVTSCERPFWFSPCILILLMEDSNFTSLDTTDRNISYLRTKIEPHIDALAACQAQGELIVKANRELPAPNGKGNGIPIVFHEVEWQEPPENW